MSLIAKNKEIELLLNLLEGNGYFADKFGKDIPVMIENIKKDFPIEGGTSIENAEFDHVREKEQMEANFQKELNQCIQEFQSKLHDLYCFMLQNGDESFYDKTVKDLGIKQTIRLKRQLKLQLSESEIDYLIIALK
jgi:organic radical activating enzyme